MNILDKNRIIKRYKNGFGSIFAFIIFLLIGVGSICLKFIPGAIFIFLSIVPFLTNKNEKKILAAIKNDEFYIKKAVMTSRTVGGSSSSNKRYLNFDDISVRLTRSEFDGGCRVGDECYIIFVNHDTGCVPICAYSSVKYELADDLICKFQNY